MMSSDGPEQRDTIHSPTQPIPGSATTPRLASIPGSIQEEDEEHDFPGSPDTARIGQSSSRARRDYGTIDTSDLGTTRQRQTLRAPSPQPLSAQSPTIRARKPAYSRRVSRAKGPQRGDKFSVDDDPIEVETDRAETYPTLKRKSSTIRRRNNDNQLPALSRVPTRAAVETPDDDVEQERIQEFQERLDNLDAEQEHDTAAEEDDVLSEAESFTLRDRQLAINETHPFGIRIWKPALYKKNRSVEKNAEEDIHSSPSQIVSNWLWVINALWTIIFGWILALFAIFAAVICFLVAFDQSAVEYGKVFWGLAGYLFWPFGKFVRLEQDEHYADEDEGEGRSISEYERWQNGDLEYGRLMFGPSFGEHSFGSIVGRHRNSIDSSTEQDALLGRSGGIDHNEPGLSYPTKRRLFGRGQWTLGRVVFFGLFYFLLAPLMGLVSLICWFLVFSIPMGRVLLILISHLRKRPLSLSFHPDASYTRDTTRPSSILLCTYRAAGLKYWKYTVDGTNIILLNFLVVVVFVIVDYYALKVGLKLDFWLTSPALLFTLALVSIIPLAYFIGQAVASISAQSSMGMGAAVNAFFSTIVEVYLYCIALNEGKAQLVEGSIIGSIFAGILLLPGLSMCSGALKRKTQRFNVKSAGATTTMLLFAVIATFGPTLFYKIYGSHELICKTCAPTFMDEPRDCRQCYFRQIPAINDAFFVQAVRPYCWFAAVLLFLSYIVGLLFTLRTHAATIWSSDSDEKKPGVTSTADGSPLETRHQSIGASTTLAPGHSNAKPNIRDSQLYKRILGQSLRSAGLPDESAGETHFREEVGVSAVDHSNKSTIPHLIPPKTPVSDETITSESQLPVLPGLSEEQNQNLVHHVAELAATAATIAARDVVQHPRTTSYQVTHTSASKTRRPSTARMGTIETADTHGQMTAEAAALMGGGQVEAAGGHDAPNWSRTKSSIILLTATVAYAIIAEVLVDTVDVVLSSVEIDEKFLGITLFALVPNTTEFLNAISFAMNGNIALSMEIGSAYALQVCLLQIPALVLFSAVHGQFIDPRALTEQSFTMIFPQWDMVTVILCVFLLSYVSSEGKSNYFKGSILVMTYLVVTMGFYYSGYTTVDVMGFDPSDTLAIAVNSFSGSRGGSSSMARPGMSRRSEL